MINLEKKIAELMEKYGDPAKGEEGKYERQQKEWNASCPPVLGVVSDNRDPEGLGRVRVRSELTAAGSESGWLSVVGQWKKKGNGWWVLPEIGTQAVVVYTAKDRSSGYVLGYIYDEKHRPPESGGNRTVVLEGKKVRAEIREGDAGETIILESRDGGLRIALDTKKGLSVQNEKGDIRVSCRNFYAKGKEGILKSKQIRSESECAQVKANGNVVSESGGKAELAGKNIRLNGRRGVSAEGKAVAKQNDRVMGFDVHQMVVPAGTGTAIAPLPHPFIGQIKGGVSSDVKVGNNGIAVKGSEARHTDRMHLQLPGTIRFQTGPECKGEISGGTVGTVKADGKEVAVIGSTVTTCNDVGARDNSTVVSLGASIPMPAIVAPWGREGYVKETEEKERKEAKFGSVRWGKTEAEEGEAVELSAVVEGVADGNMVTLQIFREGTGPEDGAAYGRIALTVQDGSVSGMWKWESDRRDLPPAEDPVFIFSAHCAWCQWKKSENRLKVKLVRPEITKAEWKDGEGKQTDTGIVGEALTLCAETKDMEEGSAVTFTVYNSRTGERAGKTSARVKDGKAEAQWTYHYNGEQLTEKPAYYYEAGAFRCRTKRSAAVEIAQKIQILFRDQFNEPVEMIQCSMCLNGEEECKCTSDSNGRIEKQGLIPGVYEIAVCLTDEQKKYIKTEFDGIKMTVSSKKEQVIEIQRNAEEVS